ncbi:glycoside hydrolase family 43 protein [Alteromonas sp. H39]|uniref:glycoside hydrolase family 43 protein n=1 Tax=Alteromonas sp. H39 TaxID=3389876 RepID=UPI0039DF2DE5
MMTRRASSLATILLGTLIPAFTAQATATFAWFDYQASGKAPQVAEGHFSNPILPGFYPDPSITRKDDTYYLVNSSFAYTPGLPIFESQDLVHWELAGHALNRPSQVTFDNLNTSRGIFAPTIRYHDGLFYIITTAVDAGGNFIITAKDPAGPWSDPVWLPEVGGIDPDLFIDDDGRAYIAHNDAPPGEPLYDGHRAVWMWEIDLDTLKVKPDTRKLLINGGVDISKQPVWIEGPHIYHVNGWYYLTCAEGGTSVNHSQVVFRTRSLSEPFVPYENNPILTQRDRPQSDITSTGHADFVQTPQGDWWSVFLATRPYEGNHYNTGRETFILPLTWSEGWPHLLPAGEPVPKTLPMPENASPDKTTFAERSRHFRDEFDKGALDPQWLGLNTFERSWVAAENGALRLSPVTDSLVVSEQSAFLGKRQQHMQFTASAKLEETQPGTTAGLVVFQNRRYHYFLGVKKAGSQRLAFVEKVEDGKVTRVAETTLEGEGPLVLTVENQQKALQFSVTDTKTNQQIIVGKPLPATLVSTQTAGGFVGALIGLHARASGE